MVAPDVQEIRDPLKVSKVGPFVAKGLIVEYWYCSIVQSQLYGTEMGRRAKRKRRRACPSTEE